MTPDESEALIIDALRAVKRLKDVPAKELAWALELLNEIDDALSATRSLAFIYRYKPEILKGEK